MTRQILRFGFFTAAIALPALWMLRAQQPPQENFTGKATRDAAPRVRAARIHFEPGARTK